MTAVTEALESLLLNDSDITGANFVLLNITYGTEEVLMDEISEITDYIQAKRAPLQKSSGDTATMPASKTRSA